MCAAEVFDPKSAGKRLLSEFARAAKAQGFRRKGKYFWIGNDVKYAVIGIFQQIIRGGLEFAIQVDFYDEVFHSKILGDPYPIGYDTHGGTGTEMHMSIDASCYRLADEKRDWLGRRGKWDVGTEQQEFLAREEIPIVVNRILKPFCIMLLDSKMRMDYLWKRFTKEHPSRSEFGLQEKLYLSYLLAGDGDRERFTKLATSLIAECEQFPGPLETVTDGLANIRKLCDLP